MKLLFKGRDAISITSHCTFHPISSKVKRKQKPVFKADHNGCVDIGSSYNRLGVHFNYII